MEGERGGDEIFEGTPYRSLGVLGAGGMGTVHLVEHREMLRKFVAKVIHKRLVPDSKAVDRFRLEAQSLGRLNHPNIVSIEGTGTTADGRPFIVLEYLRGHTLSTEIREGKIPVAKALDYARQYLSALHAAHDAGIVHRDLKPGNLFIITGFDGRPAVKVLDFGLAKVLPDAPTDAPSPLAESTTSGNLIGTPRYMSPEQARGDDVDRRGDVYAAAVVLYKTLTGVGPFGDQAGPEAQMRAHVELQPVPPSSHGPLSPWLDRAILRALSKEASERFSSAQEFLDALSEAPLHPSGREQEFSINPWHAFFAALLVGAVLVLVGQFIAAR